MKKLLIPLLILPLLNACSDWTANVFVHEERILVSLEDQDSQKWLYPNTRKALSKKYDRTSKLKNMKSVTPENSLCDVYPYVQLDEAKLPVGKYKFDMNSIYKVMFGITYDQACEKTPRFNTKDPEIEVINTAKNSGVLSNTQVKEITEAVKTCERAKVKVINLKDSGKKLTVKDYESIMDITSDCNDFLLEKALNE